MNLIEQLGGYEAAKEKRDDINYTLENSEFLGGGDAREGLYERLESIDKALIEYRRQHNIFEVGDLVVDTKYKDSDVQEVRSIRGNRMEVFHKNKDYYFATFVFAFRHASDEEIKAGHRL